MIFADGTAGSFNIWAQPLPPLPVLAPPRHFRPFAGLCWATYASQTFSTIHVTGLSSSLLIASESPRRLSVILAVTPGARPRPNAIVTVNQYPIAHSALPSARNLGGILGSRRVVKHHDA